MPESISVVIPVRDRASFVGDAIASALAQTHRPSQIILVDDGSQDGTMDVLATFAPEITLLQTRGVGPGGARNAGLAAAQGDLVAFLDSDDIWPEDALAGLAAALTHHKADIAWGLATVEILPGGELPSPGWPLTATRIVSIPTMLFRSSKLKAMGGFSSLLQFGEDSEFLMRARDAGLRIAEHDANVLIYRRHPGNMTNDRQSATRAWFDVARASMLRRRGVLP